MAAANPLLIEFNKKNREFWAGQKILMDRRMSDRAILQTAVETIESETKRQVALRIQKSFEEALRDAEKAKQRFICQQAQLGGKAEKADSLQKIIIDIVRQSPEISFRGLLEELRQRHGDEIVDEVDGRNIYFRHAGSAVMGEGDAAAEKKVISYSAPISGLKHRLTRARKKISQESKSR